MMQTWGERGRHLFRRIRALARRGEERRLQHAILAHPYGSRPPVVPCRIVPDLEPTERDVAICERLLKSYRLSSRAALPASDLWATIRKAQGRYLALLDAGTPAQLAAYLCNMSRHEATSGTIQGDLEHARLLKEPEYRRFVAIMIKDKLVSLAEALGVLPCENPERREFGRNLYGDAGDLVRRISDRLGMDITPPDIDGGLLKIEAGRSLLHERDLNAVHTARTLSRLQPRSVCEIGAGTGRVAYWSYRMGLRSYAMVDLPHINVVQGFYLLKSLPQAGIRLHGEEGPGELRIFPCDAVERVGRVDLALNQDSFPEIDHAAVGDYLKWMRRNASRFFSINHEDKPPHALGTHLNVPEVVGEVGGFSLESRDLYWLRKGYVMELYKVNPAD